MDIAITQDALINLQGFGEQFTTSIQTAFQSAIDFWTQGFNFGAQNNTTAEAGTDFSNLSSQFGLGAGAGVEAGAGAEAGTDAGAGAGAGIDLGVDLGVNTNL